MSAQQTRPGQQHAEDSYYVSITDMLIGLLFLFIIMLMYFATQLSETTTKITRADDTRADLILLIADHMRKKGVEVVVDERGGVLRFPSEDLFERASAKPMESGKRVLSALAEALSRYLPCYSYGVALPADAPCKPTGHYVDAILVEGHTDQTPIKGAKGGKAAAGAGIEDNWTLSTARAANVYRQLIIERPALESFYNAEPGTAEARRLFAIAGYADQRPIAFGTDESSKAANRRVDIRFVMALPKPEDIAPKIDGLERPDKDGAPIKIDQKLKFTVDEPTDAYLRHGWSWREAWGVWSVGTESSVEIPIGEGNPTKAHSLELELVAYVPVASRMRKVSLDIDGVEAAIWNFQGPKNAYKESIVLAPGMVAAGKRLMLRFRIENPVVPKAVENSGDDRPIGVGLQSVRLREVK